MFSVCNSLELWVDRDQCGVFFHSLGMIPMLIEVWHRLWKTDPHCLRTWPLFDLAPSWGPLQCLWCGRWLGNYNQMILTTSSSLPTLYRPNKWNKRENKALVLLYTHIGDAYASAVLPRLCKSNHNLVPPTLTYTLPKGCTASSIIKPQRDSAVRWRPLKIQQDSTVKAHKIV